MTKVPVLHPFLLAAYPVLALYSHNRFEMLPRGMLLPLVVSVSGALLLWLALSVVLRSAARAGLLVSLVVVLFFSYGHLYSLLEGLRLGALAIGRNRYMLPVWAVVSLAGAFAILRTKKDLATVTMILNVVGGGLVAMALASTLPLDLAGRVSVPDLAELDDPEWRDRTRSSSQDMPDVYYIIVDRYANADILQRTFGFDNSDFIGGLRDRGFYVAPKSRCNYAATFLSLASSLNLTYLDEVQDRGADSRDRTIVYRLLEDHKVQRYLRSEGYRYIHLGSWWQPTQANPHADRNIAYGTRLSEFSKELVTTTLLGPVFPGLFFRPRVHRERVLFKFDQMAELINEHGPKFIFLHMLIPHDPYLFNRDGSVVSETQRRERSEEENYLNQLEFTNTRILRLIDQILEASQGPPIILLAADEGLKLPQIDHRNLLTPETTAKRVGILNAFYLPGVDTSELYPTITPVNTFRLLFDLYFGTSYGLLEDRVYWFEDERHPYRFVDVTEQQW